MITCKEMSLFSPTELPEQSVVFNRDPQQVKRLTYQLPVFRVSLVREAMVTAERKTVSGPKDVAALLSGLMGDADREMLAVVLLNTKNGVLGVNVVSVGDLNSSIVNPRELFKVAILAGAASVILAHNHPSGDPTPSPEDAAVTKRIQQGGELLGIDVLDHVVIGDGCWASLKERGII